jgi:hypothetical protein
MGKRKHNHGQQHHGKHRGIFSGDGGLMGGRSAPYLKKETVVLTDTIKVPSNANIAGD